MKVMAEFDERANGYFCTADEVPVVMKALNDLYSKIWCEAMYDPLNDSTRKFAQELLPHIEKLNAIVRFKK